MVEAIAAGKGKRDVEELALSIDAGIAAKAKNPGYIHVLVRVVSLC